MGKLGTREADINLAVAARVAAVLRSGGIEVILTRTKDASVSLRTRVNRANNADAAAFVSLHCNSADSDASHGTEAYYYTTSDAGKKLATAILRPLVRATSLADRGVKSAGFYVLRHTRMPAALIELAFISNETEEELLRDESFQTKAARAIADGIVAWLRGGHASLGWLPHPR